MALDPNDRDRLHLWSFLEDFQKLRSDFIDLARIARNSVEDLKQARATPEDCEIAYQGVLLSTQIFRGILARKRFISPTFYPSHGLVFARYVLHNYWAEISL
jgi:hypothetical protein